MLPRFSNRLFCGCAGLILALSLVSAASASPLSVKELNAIPSRSLRGFVADNIHSVFPKSKDDEFFSDKTQGYMGETNRFLLGTLEGQYSVIEVVHNTGGSGARMYVLILSKEQREFFSAKGKLTQATVYESRGVFELDVDYEGEIKLEGRKILIGKNTSSRSGGQGSRPRTITLAIPTASSEGEAPSE